MVTKNSEYKAITNLSESIKTANELRKQKEDLEKQIEKKRAVKFSERHDSFPYGQRLEEKENFLSTRGFFHYFTQIFINLLIYGTLLILPLGILFGLDVLEIFAYQEIEGNTVYLAALAIVYIIILFIWIKTFKPFNQYFVSAQQQRREDRYNRKHRTALTKAYDETKDMIEDYRRILDAEIDELDDRLSKVDSELSHTEKIIENNAQVPSKYIKHIDKIIAYFEDKRAKTTQEAINLLVKEQREDRFFHELSQLMSAQTKEIKSMQTQLASLDNLAVMPAPVEEADEETDEFLEKVQKTKQKRRKTKKELKAEKKAKKKAKK